MKEGDGKVTYIRHDDEVEKDLGVLFDRKLSFIQHIGCTVKKVNRMIGLTRRTFHYMDQEVFRLLFTSLMRPHLDYADCIWSPHLPSWKTHREERHDWYQTLGTGATRTE